MDDNFERMLRQLIPSPEGALLEKLFQDLPSPLTDYTIMASPKTEKAIRAFTDGSKRLGSLSGEQDLRISTRTNIETPFLAKMGLTAIRKTIPDQDTSIQAQHLRYLRWVIRGRKDGESQFTSAVSDVDHSVLPDPAKPAPCAACGDTKASEQPSCAACGKTKASLKACTGCKFLTDGHTTFATYYCDEACQMTHRKQHKEYCNSLRMLWRSMSIFDKIYTIFVEMAYEHAENIPRIWEEDGILKVQMPDDSEKLESAYKGMHILCKAPDVTGVSREQRISARVMGRCGEMANQAGPLFHYFLHRTSCSCLPRKTNPVGKVFANNATNPTDVRGRVERVHANVKNAHRPVCFIEGPEADPELLHISSMCSHQLFRVTLPGGSQVAVDITRQQYGWKEFASPWEQYRKHRVCQFADIEELEISKDGELPPAVDLSTHEKALNYGQAHVDVIDQVKRAKTMTAKWVACALREQIDRDYGGLSKLLALDGRAFVAAQDAIVAKAEAMFAQNIAAFGRRQDQRIFVDEKSGIRVALGRDLCKKLEKAWFTEEEYEQYKHCSPGTLLRIWKQRRDKAMKGSVLQPDAGK